MWPKNSEKNALRVEAPWRRTQVKDKYDKKKLDWEINDSTSSDIFRLVYRFIS